MGVDVFFVISGYLITSIILREMEQGKFSIVRFYERRARRILPALFFVIVCCLPFAWMWMLPDELKRFGQSLVAVATFSSNIYFWRATDYFAAAAEEQPLLHTWSLAVEEQYYVLFPLFLMVCWRFGKSKLFWLTAFVATCSLLLAEWGWRYSTIANFYLLPTRAWELLVGSLLAFFPKALLKRLSANKLSGSFALFGILLICYAIFNFDKTTPFPSIFSIVPVIGTALVVIFSNVNNSVGKILSTKLFVGFGLISYSAYLWHQPVFAFQRLYHFDKDHSFTNAFFWASLSLIMAFITTKLVENPIRERKLSLGVGVLRTTGVALSLLVFIGLIINFFGDSSQILKARLGEDRSRVYLEIKAQSSRQKQTENLRDSSFNPGKDINLGSLYKIGSDVVPRVAFWGDSHAGVLIESLHDELEKRNMAALVAEARWCPPALGVVSSDSFRNTKCPEFNQQVISRISQKKEIKTVFLISQWGNTTQGFRDDHHPIPYKLVGKDNNEIEKNPEILAHGLDATIKSLKASGVDSFFIVTTVPEHKFRIEDAVLRKLLHTDLDGKIPLVDGISVEAYKKRNKEAIKVFELLSERHGVKVLRSDEVFCRNDACSAQSDDGTLYYLDTNHLTLPAAKILTEYLLAQLDAELP